MLWQAMSNDVTVTTIMFPQKEKIRSLIQKAGTMLLWLQNLGWTFWPDVNDLTSYYFQYATDIQMLSSCG